MNCRNCTSNLSLAVCCQKPSFGQQERSVISVLLWQFTFPYHGLTALDSNVFHSVYFLEYKLILITFFLILRYMIYNLLLKRCTVSLIQNLLDADAHTTLKQRVGFKSAMLADVRPLTDGRVKHPTFRFSFLCLFI